MALFRRRTPTVTPPDSNAERIEHLFATLEAQDAELTARIDALVDAYAGLHAQVERLEIAGARPAIAA
jgi:hypothetical protein